MDSEYYLDSEKRDPGLGEDPEQVKFWLLSQALVYRLWSRSLTYKLHNHNHKSKEEWDQDQIKASTQIYLKSKISKETLEEDQEI
jgi:hypothetical protein